MSMSMIWGKDGWMTKLGCAIRRKFNVNLNTVPSSGSRLAPVTNGPMDNAMQPCALSYLHRIVHSQNREVCF